MDHAVFHIKAMPDQIEILCISGLIPPKNRVGDVVRNLHEPGGPGINEKWRVCDVSKDTPLRSNFSKFPAEPLQRSLASGFVEYDHSSLRVSGGLLSSQKKIEAFAEVFKGHRHDIIFRV